MLRLQDDGRVPGRLAAPQHAPGDRRQSLAGEIDLTLSGGGDIEILRIDEAVSLDLQPDHAPRQPRDDQPPVRLRHRRAERADAVLLRRYQGLDRAPATGWPPATSRARSVARRARRSATSTVDPGATAGSGFSAARSSIRAEMT